MNLNEGLEGGWSIIEPGRRARFDAANRWVRMQGEVRVAGHGADLELTVSNLDSTSLPDLSALVCYTVKRTVDFADHDTDSLWVLRDGRAEALGPHQLGLLGDLYLESSRFDAPVTVVQGAAGPLATGIHFDGSTAVGGNRARGGGCLHAQPQFGALAPGASRSLRGRIAFGREGPEALVLELAERAP